MNLFYKRNNKTCQEHNLKMCSLKQIQKVSIENVCTLQQLKFQIWEATCQVRLTFEKIISCEYVSYFLTPGKPALLHIHYNMSIDLNEIIRRFARLHSCQGNGTGQYLIFMNQKPRKGDLKSKNFQGGSMPLDLLEPCAFGASLGNRSVFIPDQRL